MGVNARLKSLFLLPAALLSVALVVLAIAYIAASGHDRLAWCGVLLASIVLPAWLAWTRRATTPRTSESLPFLLLASGAGPFIAAWEVFEEGVAAWPVFVAALTGTTMLAVYVFWYSRFGRQASEMLAVGKKLPAFELADADGAIFRSAELDGSPAVLVFYRGNWCPFCMAQLREIADRYEDFAKLGVKLVFISPQDAVRSKELAARFGMAMHFLVDEANRLAGEFGIAIRHGVPAGMPGGYAADSVMPTVIAVSASGTILFSDQTDNYRVRPEPDVFASILRRAGAQSR